MISRLLYLTGLLIAFNFPVIGQDTIHMELGGFPVIAIVTDGDTLFTTELASAVISPVKRKAATRDLRQYRRLIYNVKRFILMPNWPEANLRR